MYTDYSPPQERLLHLPVKPAVAGLTLIQYRKKEIGAFCPVLSFFVGLWSLAPNRHQIGTSPSNFLPLLTPTLSAPVYPLNPSSKTL
jgi:hypothetical protein